MLARQEPALGTGPRSGMSSSRFRPAMSKNVRGCAFFLPFSASPTPGLAYALTLPGDLLAIEPAADPGSRGATIRAC